MFDFTSDRHFADKLLLDPSTGLKIARYCETVKVKITIRISKFRKLGL